MLKDRYKIILIKEGKFNLKQFSVSPHHILIAVIAVVVITSSLFIIFSEQFVKWTGSKVIEKHRKNNQALIQTIEGNQKTINVLLEELDKIKKQDNMLRKLVKLPPIHDDIRKMGFGGTQNKSGSEDINYLLPGDPVDLDALQNDINYVNRLINLELLIYEELTEEININLDKILTFPAIYPMKNGRKQLSSNFGYRRDPFSNKYKFHDGHDYSAQIGTGVHSTADGRVKQSRYWGSFGNYIEVDHGNGYVTVYGHLSKRNVKTGDKVLRGQKIGEVGNTGRSTAPHLHYEIKYQKKSIDPTPFYFDTSIN